MADPKMPIQSQNGIVISLEDWARRLCREAAWEAITQHQAECPARRLWWVVVGAAVVAGLGITVAVIGYLV